MKLYITFACIRRDLVLHLDILDMTCNMNGRRLDNKRYDMTIVRELHKYSRVPFRAREISTNEQLEAVHKGVYIQMSPSWT